MRSFAHTDFAPSFTHQWLACLLTRIMIESPSISCLLTRLGVNDSPKHIVAFISCDCCLSLLAVEIGAVACKFSDLAFTWPHLLAKGAVKGLAGTGCWLRTHASQGHYGP